MQDQGSIGVIDQLIVHKIVRFKKNIMIQLQRIVYILQIVKGVLMTLKRVFEEDQISFNSRKILLN